jgi:hypothetical protein
MPQPVPVPELLNTAEIGHPRYRPNGEAAIKRVEARGRKNNFKAGTSRQQALKLLQQRATASQKVGSMTARIGASTTPNPKPASQKGNGKKVGP